MKPGRWSLWTRAERIADFCLNTTCVQISAHIYLQLSEICASQTTVVTEKHTGDHIGTALTNTRALETRNEDECAAGAKGAGLTPGETPEEKKEVQKTEGTYT